MPRSRGEAADGPRLHVDEVDVRLTIRRHIEGDCPAVRRPTGSAASHCKRRDLPAVRPLRITHPDLARRRRPVGSERDPPPVGRILRRLVEARRRDEPASAARRTGGADAPDIRVVQATSECEPMARSRHGHAERPADGAEGLGAGDVREGSAVAHLPLRAVGDRHAPQPRRSTRGGSGEDELVSRRSPIEATDHAVFAEDALLRAAVDVDHVYLGEREGVARQANERHTSPVG